MPQPSSWLVLVLLVTERFHSGPPEHSSGNGLICLYTHTHRLTLTHMGSSGSGDSTTNFKVVVNVCAVKCFVESVIYQLPFLVVIRYGGEAQMRFPAALSSPSTVGPVMSSPAPGKQLRGNMKKTWQFKTPGTLYKASYTLHLNVYKYLTDHLNRIYKLKTIKTSPLIIIS